jgi:hypothetical protein
MATIFIGQSALLRQRRSPCEALYSGPSKQGGEIVFKTIHLLHSRIKTAHLSRNLVSGAADRSGKKSPRIALSGQERRKAAR